MNNLLNILKHPLTITILILAIVIGGVFAVIKLVPENPENSAAYVERYWGDPNAKVIVEEFGDFQCPGCRVFYLETEGKLKEKYGDNIKFVFHHMPLPIHASAQNAAEAAEAAGAQGKFWEYHDLLYTRQSADSAEWTNDKFVQYAGELGLDTERFKKELNDNYYKKAVGESKDIGDKKGISATPTVYVNGKEVKGPIDPSSGQQTIADFDTLSKEIDAILGTEATSTPTVTSTATVTPTSTN